MFVKFIKASLAIILLIGSSLPLTASAASTTNMQLAPATEVTNAGVLGFPPLIQCSDSLGRIGVPSGYFLVKIFASYPGCDYVAGEIERPDPDTDRMVVCSLFNVNTVSEWEIVSIFGGGGQLTPSCYRNVQYTIERIQ